jgi:hypothetical protein
MTSGHARADVERAVAFLRPTIEAAILDPSVSHDRSLVIVVMDPNATAGDDGEGVVLGRFAFGRAGEVAVDYEGYAVDKARAAWRERCDTSVLRERGAALLSAALPLVGGLHRHGWTLGVSGAVPCFDEALGACLVELLHALALHRAGTDANHA